METGGLNTGDGMQCRRVSPSKLICWKQSVATDASPRACRIEDQRIVADLMMRE
jgi:hypothetical protein